MMASSHSISLAWWFRVNMYIAAFIVFISDLTKLPLILFINKRSEARAWAIADHRHARESSTCLHRYLTLKKNLRKSFDPSNSIYRHTNLHLRFRFHSRWPERTRATLTTSTTRKVNTQHTRNAFFSHIIQNTYDPLVGGGRTKWSG